MAERDTMFRFSMIVSFLLIVGITAKPWNKHENEAIEDKVVSIDEKGRLSWEVEPPEDMHDIHDDIDPRMRIWKVPKVEEDWDELNHPSTNELRLQIQNTDPAADDLAENYVNVEYRQEAKDGDSIDHPVFAEVIAEEPQDSEEDNEAREKVLRYMAPFMAGHKVEVGGAPYQPETNEDQVSSVEMEAVRSNREGRIHLQPEEDMDDLYHKEVLIPVLYQDDNNAAAPVHKPAQRKYTKPEVDMDDLYHK